MRQAINLVGFEVQQGLGYKHPICERCIAKEYGLNTTQLRDRLEDFFGMRPCQGVKNENQPAYKKTLGRWICQR